MSGAELKYSPKKKPGKTKAFFICVLIASFLWLVHSLNTVYTHTFKIPVAFSNLPQHKRPLSQLPAMLSVDVKASGLKLAFMLLKKSDNGLEIDFNSLKGAGGLNYVLSASRLNFKSVLGFESQVKHISPDTLYFSEKTGYQKDVALKVPFDLKCRQGYAYKKPEVNPAFVTIYGDTAGINLIDTIYTQAVSLNDLHQSIHINTPVLKPKNGIYTNVDEASVFIEVEQLIEQSINLPVNDIKPSAKNRVNIYPSRVKVRFTSIQNSFNSQDTGLFKASINSDRINRQTKKCEVFLSTRPGNVTIMDIDPKEVEILILNRK